MNISHVKPGDIVECNVRGQVFYAFADGKPFRERGAKQFSLNILPHGKASASYRRVTARQVTGVWRRLKSRPAPLQSQEEV